MGKTKTVSPVTKRPRSGQNVPDCIWVDKVKMLPAEIERLIHTYRKEFERVEKDILETLSIYYTVENRASEVLDLVKTMDLSVCHFKHVEIMLCDITMESSKLVSRILEDETVTPVQLLMLNNLSEQIQINNVFQILFHPLCLINLL